MPCVTVSLLYNNFTICKMYLLYPEKLDTTTENRENPSAQTSAKAESSLDYLCHELLQHVCKYCSEVPEVPSDNMAQSTFLLLELVRSDTASDLQSTTSKV